MELPVCNFHISLTCVFLAFFSERIIAFRRECPGNSMAQYKMELRGTWVDQSQILNSRLLPRGFPEQWRWSTGIGVSLDAREDPYYNETVRMKIYNFVTKGGLSKTVAALSQPGSGVMDSFLIPGMDSSGGEASAIFFVDSNHSRVSFMSRMNKKPHWILSAESINLCHNGQFRDTFELDLFPFESKPRPSQTHVQRPVSPGAYGNRRSYSIVLPSQPREMQHNRANHPFNGQTLVAPLPFPLQRETQQHLMTRSTVVNRETLVAPSRLQLQTWKTAAGLPENINISLLPNETMLDVRHILFPRPQATTELSQPEKMSIERRKIPEVTPRRSDPYMEIIQTTLDPDIFSTYSYPPDHSSPQPPTMINSFYSFHGAPKLSRRRLPPDSENEVPVVRRAVRSVRYGLRPKNSITNFTGNAYRAHPSRYTPASAQYQPQGYQSPSGLRNSINSPVRGQQPRSNQPDVLPRLATAKFTKIASYQLSHILALAKRRMRTGDAPLPITIDKSMINSVHLPYPAVRSSGNRIPGRSMSGHGAYNGMWPSPSMRLDQRWRHQSHRQHNPYNRYPLNNQPVQTVYN